MPQINLASGTHGSFVRFAGTADQERYLPYPEGRSLTILRQASGSYKLISTRRMFTVTAISNCSPTGAHLTKSGPTIVSGLIMILALHLAVPQATQIRTLPSTSIRFGEVTGG
jgi:hypothetical protein